MRGQLMNHKRYPLLITLLCLALLIPCATPPRAAHAANRHPLPLIIDDDSAPAVKISPDLLSMPADPSVQGNSLLVAETVRAIVQTRGLSGATLEVFINARGGR